MAAPVVDSITTDNDTGSGDNVEPNVPGTPASGDVFLAWHDVGVVLDLATPGFTDITGQLNSETAAVRISNQLAYRVSDGTETGTFNFGNAGGTGCVTCLLITGANASWQDDAAWTQGDTGSANLVAPTVTSAGADRLDLRFYGWDGARGISSAPSGYAQESLNTLIADYLAVYSKTVGSGAAGTQTLVIDASDQWNAASVLIAPAAVSGPTLKTGSDTLALVFTESSAPLVSLDRADTLGLSLSEAAALAVTLQAVDTLDLSLTEAAALSVSLLVADSLDLSVAEAVSLFGSMARSDTLDLALAEAAVPTLFVSAADALDLSLAAAVVLAATVTAADTLGLALTDTVAGLQAQLARTDGLALGLTEAASIFATVSAADTLALSTVEAKTLLALLERADTLGISLAEAALVTDLGAQADVGQVIALLGSLIKTVGLDGSQLDAALAGSLIKVLNLKGSNVDS